jgi:uncharacterized protein YegL
MSSMTDGGRTETGGPDRTPRSEIVSVRKRNRKYEPVLLLDMSGSMDWGADDENNADHEYPSAYSRRAIVEEALPLVITRLAGEDSEAEGEQADGSDELGGLMTFGFASQPVKIGDLNESNAKRKLQSVQWGGGTHVVPAMKLALAKYVEEFEDDEDDSRVHLILIVTDGTADDWRELEPYLMAANPNRVIAVAIVGHGEKAAATYAEYRQVAEKNQKADEFGHAHVHVVLFDGVTSPAEIAEDLITLAA